MLTACAPVLVRDGIDEMDGEALPARVMAERVSWCAALVREMTAWLLREHWNPADVRVLAAGRDAAGRPLPKQAYTALRRLDWPMSAPDGVHVNDRVTRMAQEQAGRLPRSAAWRDSLTVGILATWPEGDPAKRTPADWAAVRAAVPGGEHLPSGVIRNRTRQVQAFAKKHGRLPADVFELEAPPEGGAVLLLAACDKQEAEIERSAADPGWALLRVKLPTCPDPRSRRDWSWVSVPLVLPPRGTSRHCPRCLAVLRHRKAPDRPAEPGWKWASCPGCGWQGDRDTGAWMRIAARGLAHQARTAAERKAGTMTIRAVDEALESCAVITPYTSPRDRSKTGPTPRREQRISQPAPRRRGIPSRQGPAARAVSVRRGAPARPGPRCPAQRPGTRARARSAARPPGARTGHAERHSAPGSTSAPTPPRPDGKPGPSRPRTRDDWELPTRDVIRCRISPLGRDNAPAVTILRRAITQWVRSSP